MIYLMMNFPFNNSLMMTNMNKLSDKLLIIMLFIMVSITYMSMFSIKSKMLYKTQFNNNCMELLWTLIPMLIILLMMILSSSILFLNNEFKMNLLSIKINGNQWFWFYNYLQFKIKFNSYLIFKQMFNFNLIETDNKLIIPINNQIMIILSSSDVIHSWTIPSINIKIDAIPNQINNMKFNINKTNILYGQCSEICGINHSFMPIMIESIKFNNFILWIKNK